MRSAVGLVAFIVLSTAAVAQDHGAPISGESFEAWLTDCFADGYCEARAEDADGTLRIGRHAEQSYWEISFTGAISPDQWSNVAVEVDDQTETFLSIQEVGAYGRPDNFYFVGLKAQTLMDRLMPGSVATIAYDDANQQPQSIIVDLSGLTAALIWIDGVQARVGSERVAEAPPYGLTPVYATNAVLVTIPVDLLDRHRADPECRPFEEIGNGRDFWADQIDADHAAYVIPCEAYAYNFTWKVYIESYSQYYEQYFAGYDDAIGWTGASVLFNVGYDTATHRLTSFLKGSGWADCGSAGVWEFTEYAFRMLQFRYEGNCEDQPAEGEELGDFPVVFTAPDYLAPSVDAPIDDAPEGKDKG